MSPLHSGMSSDQPKMVTIQFVDGAPCGIRWDGKDYGPGGQAGGYNGGDTVTCALSVAYTQVASGRARVVDPSSLESSDPFAGAPDMIENRDPQPRRRR